MITVDCALERIVTNIPVATTTNLPIERISGHILAEPVTADRDLPPYDRSTMDGFCLRASNFKTGITDGLEIRSEISAGRMEIDSLQPGHAAQIMTGGVVPKDADMVVPIENCVIKEKRVYFKTVEFYPRQNIARQGEDNVKGSVLIKPGTKMTASALAVAASVGYTRLCVYKKPTVAIMTSGNEIIPPSDNPEPFQIRDCNTISCTILSKQMGIEPIILGIVPDDEKKLKKVIERGLHYDILIMSGGVSAGKYDYTPAVLKQCGVEEIYHKMKLKPGKPNWFGNTHAGAVVFGLPGNPVSVQVGFKLFVETYIKGFMGYASPKPIPMMFTLDAPISKSFPLEYYFPVKITNRVKQICTPVTIKSSGDFSNFALNDGIAKMDLKTAGYNEHDAVPVFLN